MLTAREAILQDRFYHENEDNEDQVWRRVADAWSYNSTQADAFYEVMAHKKAYPNTPAIANAGRTQQQGSACFVLPIADSLVDGPDSIMNTLTNAVAVHKTGGGTGFSFGRLRPKGTTVSTTGRPAPGPVEFLRLYSGAINCVTQAGMRNGANMAIIPVDHPDIYEFINSKSTEGAIHNFNISIAITDDFMRDPDSRLWEAIVEGAWRNGEPGVLFIDTVNRTAYHPEVIEATNPCGEVPLLPYEACVLGSINLAAHVKLMSGMYQVDWEDLAKTVRTMVLMLDNVVSLQDYPLPIIKETHHRYRKIGLGVMGYADALIELGVVYGTDDAIRLAETFMGFIQDASYKASEDLTDTRGVYKGYYPGLPSRRNLMCQVIAPTGTISRLAGCSFGIEPNFAKEYDSYVVGGIFRERHRLSESPYFRSTGEVTPRAHVRTQAAFQKYTDQAVSKTVNLPSSATVEDVARIYREAWEEGCKGITVLRENSREDVVIKDCASGVCEL